MEFVDRKAALRPLTMQQAAAKTGRTLGVAYYRRMYPKLARAIELMEAGAIGRPVFAEAASHDWFYPADGFRAWLLDPASAGGGPLADQFPIGIKSDCAPATPLIVKVNGVVSLAGTLGTTMLNW
jgi:hypothetical protein